MTTGEKLYQEEQRAAIQRGELLPAWCNLDGTERAAWVQRGLNDEREDTVTEPEFQAFPKIPRLNRPVIVTEKIDGTNAAIGVLEDGRVYAQSRKRIITPGKQTDNHGFAGFVADHAEVLRDLGVGLHFGEWWGSGIQRGYGLDHKVFSLFNPDYELTEALEQIVTTVPVLTEGPLQDAVDFSLTHLELWGSQAAPGYDNPEGIVVYHTASRHTYKVTLEGDESYKGAN